MLALLALSPLGYGQDPLFKNFTVDDGLASNETYQMLEDLKGQIWIATDQGISKFDGYQFKNFTTENGLSENTIYGFHLDRRGRIWLRSESGNLAYIQGNTVIPVLPSTHSGAIISIYVDRKDTVWFATKRQHHKAYQLANGQYNLEVLNDGVDVRQIDTTRHGIIRSYLSRPIQQLTYKVNQQQFTADLSAYNYVDKTQGIFLENRPHNAFVMSIDGHLLEVNPDTVITLYADTLTNSHSFAFLDHKTLFTGGTPTGARLHSSGRKKHAFLGNLRVTHGLKDRESGYWFSTLTNGIYYTQHLTIATFQVGDDDKIVDFQEDSTGQLFAFGYYGDVFRHEQGRFIRIHSRGTHPRKYRFSALDARGQVFWSTGDSVHREGSSLPAKPQRYPAFNFSDGTTVKLYGATLLVTPPQSSSSTTKLSLPRHLLSQRAKQFGDTLFIPTLEGLVLFDPTHKITNLATLYPELNLRVDAIAKDAQNRLWIATNTNGLFVLDGKLLTHINRQYGSGKIGNICKHLAFDQNYLWASSEQGLIRIDLANFNNIETFNTKDGLLSSSITALFVCDACLYIGHGNGITKFPSNTSKKGTTPTISIERVSINGRVMPPQRHFGFCHLNGPISIHFTGISHASNLHYKYRFANERNAPYHYTIKRNVEFVSIPSGTYVFEVIAINEQGLESTPKILTFKVPRPFWMRWWFITFIILVIIGFVYLFLRHRIQKLNHKVALERKMMHIEQQALRARMNPHFIFNALNSVQAYVMANDKRNANKYLALFSRLIRSILDHSSEKLIVLAREMEVLEAYLKLEALRFKDKLDYEIEIPSDLDTQQYKVPPLLLQPYVENAIWHGIMHKPASGKVKVQLEAQPNHLLCTITDNGVGRAAAQKIKARKNHPHKSVGMKITADRIELTQAFYGGDFSVSVVDLMHDNQPEGTRVKITIPYLT